MESRNADYNTAYMRGSDGVDYLGAGTLNTNKRWNAIVINEDAVITSGVFVRKDKTTVITYSPTWLGVTLAAGAFIPLPFMEVEAGVEEQVYCKGLTVASGSVLLYID
jgi:hypothetical protein